jgi:hypothetical protein
LWKIRHWSMCLNLGYLCSSGIKFTKIKVGLHFWRFVLSIRWLFWQKNILSGHTALCSPLGDCFDKKHLVTLLCAVHWVIVLTKSIWSGHTAFGDETELRRNGKIELDSEEMNFFSKVRPPGSRQGCQTVLGKNAKTGGKIYQNDHKICQVATKCTKWQ